MGKEDAWVDNEAIRNYEKKLEELRVKNINKSTSDLQALPQVFATLLSKFKCLHCILEYTEEMKEGKDRDAAFFFGLSGIGKTTLSTDHHMNLIGDIKHCWSENGMSNNEEGCYAKCIDLS
ncbi:hypothetical protein QYF36_005433 [Acer negundo]|nr:hypothetical protein QYF36_005433 [Acer negundo]